MRARNILDDGDLQPVFVDLLRRLQAARSANSTTDPLFSLGQRVVATARRFARSPGVAASLTRDGWYQSVNPAITPAPPGVSKAVLFVGDVLHAAGFQVPTRGVNGFVTYLEVARWPPQRYFRRLDRSAAAAGDLLLHAAVAPQLEVLLDVDGGVFTTLGVVDAGLREGRRPVALWRGVVLRPALHAGQS